MPCLAAPRGVGRAGPPLWGRSSRSPRQPHALPLWNRAGPRTVLRRRAHFISRGAHTLIRGDYRVAWRGALPVQPCRTAPHRAAGRAGRARRSAAQRPCYFEQPYSETQAKTGLPRAMAALWPRYGRAAVCRRTDGVGAEHAEPLPAAKLQPKGCAAPRWACCCFPWRRPAHARDPRGCDVHSAALQRAQRAQRPRWPPSTYGPSRIDPGGYSGPPPAPTPALFFPCFRPDGEGAPRDSGPASRRPDLHRVASPTYSSQ